MSSKGRTLYVCAECGAQANKWAGQCGDCGAWNCLQEAPAMPPAGKSGIKPAGYTGAAVGSEVRILAEVDATAEIRQSCGNGELDRVLGGGLVQGSVTLIGGDPGIGKSTLLLQVLAELAAPQPHPVCQRRRIAPADQPARPAVEFVPRPVAAVAGNQRRANFGDLRDRATASRW
jgi:DNA repair protein RadA/Sms